MSLPDDDAQRRGALREHVRDLTSDLRQWVEWAALTGAIDLPWEAPAPVAAASPSSSRPPRAAPPPPRRPGPPPNVAPPYDPRQGPPAHHLQAPPPMDPGPGFEPGPLMDAPLLGQGPPTAQPLQPPPRPPQPGETLDDIEAELGACTRCELSQGRKHIVYGVGSPTAKVVIIGEAPGRNEDLTGEPFVGRAGKLLNRMLEAIGLRREDVYICNVIKCRPPNNRDPVPAEVATCSPFLHRQVRAIRPRVIMTVGRFAGQCIIGTEATMGQMRRSVASVGGTPVVATYHPAYLLRTPSMKARAWEDLLKVRRLIAGADPAGM